MKTISVARAIVGALMTMAAAAVPRRKQPAPVLQIKSKRIEGSNLQIELSDGTTITGLSIGTMLLSQDVGQVSKLNGRDAAICQQLIEGQAAVLLNRAGGALINAQEAYERERQQKVSRSRKHRARKRKQKRGY